MRDLKLSHVLISISALALLSGCTVRKQEQTSKDGGTVKKDVEIRTPFGSLSVHKGGADAKDAGLTTYPGATVAKDQGFDDDGDASANVNISSSLFGLKLVVLKFETSDPPDKVLSFYRKDMARYGKVLDCSGAISMNFDHHSKDAPVSCDSRGNSHENYKEELKVGTENNQRVMAVKPKGSGSEFALVYVRAHGENQDTF